MSMSNQVGKKVKNEIKAGMPSLNQFHLPVFHGISDEVYDFVKLFVHS